MTMRSETRPIFVVGSPRSGTTLLRFVLSSHPRIYIPDETGFIPFLLPDIEQTLTQQDVVWLLSRIGRLNRAWYNLVDDPVTLYRSLPEPRLAPLLDHLYRLKIAPHKAVRWGDKTPSYVRYIPLLSRLFPAAQFVHIIRDGRDATVSAKRKWKGRWYMDEYYLLRNWLRNVQEGQRAGRSLGPDRYMELRYEHLVREPRPTLTRLCQFLGETLHPSMLDHTALAREQIGPRGHVEVRRPISAGSVGRWRREMTPFAKKMADLIAGETLAALGYELANLPPLTPGERARLALLAAKFHLTDTVRSALTAAGILTLNRGKRRR